MAEATEKKSTCTACHGVLIKAREKANGACGACTSRATTPGHPGKSQTANALA